MITPLLPLVSSITPFQAFILGAVQGLTELLPISSSAHLYIVPTVLGWHYEGVAFDVALHGGTLVALVIAFWKDWLKLVTDLASPDGVIAKAARDLWLKLVVCTIPGAIAGKLLDKIADEKLRYIPLQAAMLAIFGIILWAADRFSGEGEETDRPTWMTSLSMGLAQCLALVPGVSRAGITMTAGRVTGLSRTAAARFSFMLATPITAGALVLKLKDIPHDVPASSMLIGVVTAAVFGIGAIHLLLGMVRRAGFGVFAVYRVALAAGLFIWIARR